MIPLLIFSQVMFIDDAWRETFNFAAVRIHFLQNCPGRFIAQPS
jgi:hypothetical protein